MIWEASEERGLVGGRMSGITKVDQGALRVLAQRLESVEEQGDMGSLLAS